LAAWTKNEGIAFLVWMALLFGASTIARPDRSLRSKIRFFLIFLGGLAIPLCAVLYLKMILGGGGIYVGSAAKVTSLASAVGSPEKTRFIALSFLVFRVNFSEWHGLWTLAFTAAVYAIVCNRDYLFKRQGWFLLALILLIDAGYFVIFHFSPFDIRKHIGWALTRLLLHHGALALVFAAEVFSPKMPARESVFHGRPV
jgi:hypothetical protein